MKILALNPPFLPRFSRASRSPAVTKSGTIYYPTWLAYATGVLEQAGHTVLLIDAPAKSLTLEAVLKIAGSFLPELIILDTATGSIHADLAAAAALRQVLPHAFITAVGTHASALASEVLRLEKAVDAVARGEYESTAAELAQCLTERRDVAGILGLSYRRPSDGTVVENPDRPFLQDLDALPFVSSVFRRHLRIEDYFYAHTRYPMVSIFTSRGCPSRCVWCLYPQVFYGHQYRHRSAENIVQEFLFIQQELPQVKEVLIDDDTFNIDVEHVRRMSSLMIDAKVTLPWTCEVRANLDLQTMRMMKAAGCRLLVAGFESGSAEVLRATKKGLDPETGRRFAEDAQRAGLLVHGCFVAGGPGETVESLEETLQYAKSLPLDTAQFFPMMVYPGTEAFEWAVKHQWLRSLDYRAWLTDDGLHNTLVERPGLSAQDLVDFCDRARREFYLRPQYVFQKAVQAIANPAELPRTLRSLRQFRRFLFVGQKKSLRG